MFDLKTGKFRKGLLQTDYLTKTIPFDYEEVYPKDIETVKGEILKNCNNKIEHLDYYLSTLGYSMTGDSSREQALWNLRGQKASDGKTTIPEALANIAPDYVVKMENNIFETTYGSRHKEVAMWKGARIAYINELSKKKQDEDVLKEVADGNGMRYKVMFGTMATMPITYKCFIVGNNTINVSMDEGMKRRLKMLQMDSDFVEDITVDDYANCRFIKNKNFIKDLQTKYKHAILALIYQYSKRYVTDGYNLCKYPDDWANETAEVARVNNKFDEFFYNRFEIDPTGEVSKRVVDAMLARYPEKVNLKDELKRMRVACSYDCKERIKGEKIKGIWTGFKEIVDENELNDDLTEVIN